MTRVTLAEYQGRCDTSHRAVGHAPKVLREYIDLNRSSCDLDVYAPEVILHEIKDISDIPVHTLDSHIVMKSGNSVFEKIRNKFRMFSNIRHVLKHSDADIVWFFNVEFYLFLYLALTGAHGRRIVVTLFLDGYHTGALASLKQKIFETGQKRVFRCISAGPSFSFKNMPYSFIPDYIYDGSVYDKYRTMEKEDYVVCLGTMDSGKQLEDLVAGFSSISYRLIITGRFYDKERLERLKAAATDNIEISDSYPSAEEYLSLIGHARYTVLPYSKENYSHQTSGVMQEALFTDSIVLTYEDILAGNSIPGLGFTSYSDIKDSLLSADGNLERNAGILKKYDDLRRSTYDRDIIREGYRRVFE
jgi:glycosyltransferase involved in cell wall biosynthesis